MSPELKYTLLVFALFVVPRGLQRYRLPGAVTCLGIGALLNIGFGLFHEDEAVKLLATLGIVAMFLFAGLEVDFAELRKGRAVLLQNVGVQLLSLSLTAAGAGWAFGLELRAALLFALALLTPSTGFILDSLKQLGLTEDERFWVKSKAIASEIVALGVLFFTVQSTELTLLSFSAMSLVAMVLVLPPVFRFFARVIAPFAPNTEFTFLVIVALVYAFITRELGVYYLVGAFLVGVTAVRLRRELPSLTSEKLLAGVELFASFFIPFYFFKAGLHLDAHDFTLESLGIGLLLVALVLPFRIGRVALHRRLVLGEAWRTGGRIGLAMLPTLVFTIVLAELLQERYGLEPRLFGALITYTLINTVVPGLLLKVPAAEYDTPEVPPVAS